MPEYRQDVISGRWTLLAPERAGRPFDYRVSPPASGRGGCPFCAGNEDQTPQSVLTLPEAPEDWQVRVVPNRYPAVEPLASAELDSPPPYARRAGHGYHEVIVEAPHHIRYQSQQSDERFRSVLLAYRQRIQALLARPGIRYVQIFRNQGPQAGASLEHLHSQLVALADTPAEVALELARASDHGKRIGACIFCQVLRSEVERGARMVTASSEVAAFCPYAARLPYETWIMPRVHHPRFESMADQLLGQVAHLLHRVLVAIERQTGGASLNFWLHTSPCDPSPFDNNHYDHYHWHVEIVPRLAMAAGFETATGWSMNWLPPELAAERLRGEIGRDLED